MINESNMNCLIEQLKRERVYPKVHFRTIFQVFGYFTCVMRIYRSTNVLSKFQLLKTNL